MKGDRKLRNSRVLRFHDDNVSYERATLYSSQATNNTVRLKLGAAYNGKLADRRLCPRCGVHSAFGKYFSFSQTEDTTHYSEAMNSFTPVCNFQDGTDSFDEFRAVAIRPDGAIVLAGTTSGSWITSASSTDGSDYAVVLMDGSLLNTPSAETTHSPTPSPTSALTTAPTLHPLSTPTPAADITHLPSSVAPVHPDLNRRDTPSPVYVEPLSTSPSGTSLGVIVGCITIGAAVGVILGVLVNRSSRRRRRGLNTGNVMSFPASGRHFPSAAPALNGTSRSAPSRHFPAGVAPVDGQSPPSPTGLY